jgi:hypothetical protein
MTDRLLGPTGPERKRRLRLLIPLFMVCLIVGAIGASSAGALTTSSPPSFTFVKDEDCTKTPACADDQPGQKDLSAHAVASPSPGDLWVAWKWDELSLSGGNTGDACALFDTGAPNVGRVNFAVCVTIAGNPAVQSTNSPRIYTCGDGKVDRCTSTYTLRPKPYGTACAVNQSGVDRTDPWHSGQQDTTALCHIDLNDVGGATSAKLVNTCSYPSQEPTSDPSDCVLIPRDAFLTIAKNAGSDTTTNFNFTVSGGASATPTVTAGSSTTIAIKSGTATSVTEQLPSTDWQFVSATCTGGTNNGTAITNGRSGIIAASDATVTCTFTNALTPPGVLTINKSCPSGAHATTDRFQPKDGTANAGSAIACEGSTTYSPAPNTAYTITEAGAGTPAANLANYTTTYSNGCSGSLARGATATCTITNTLKAAPVVTINKSCPSGPHATTDRFQPKDGTADAGSAIACDGSTTYSPAPDTAYTITEAGAGTPAANLANYTTTYSNGCSGNLARGATATCTITNTLRTFTVVTFVCEGGQLYESSVTFDGQTKLSLAHNATLPTGVDEQKLCSDITTGARFTDKKSGTKTGSVTITP